MNKSKLVVLVFCCAFASVLNGQSLKAFMKAADEAIADKNYFNAMHYYSNAIEFDSSALNVRNGFGKSSLEFNAYSIAEREFQYVVDNDTSSTYPLAVFNLAEAQQNLGKYDEARRNYELYLSEYSGDDQYYTFKAEKEIEAIDWSKDKINNPKPGEEVSWLDNGVNTPYSEFGALSSGDDFYYSSLRYELDDGSSYPDRLFSNVLTSDNGDGGNPVFGDSMMPTVTETKTKVKEGDKSSRKHFAHNTFSMDGGKMYYTICEYLNASDIRCDLYVSNVDDEGSFRKGSMLGGNINGSSFTTTQPSIGYDPVLDKEVLFFSSDREGGKGGHDIWYTIIDGDNYSEPINMAVINTSEDEVTPFYHKESSTLYFSSKGYLGLGGFDVYKTYRTGDTFTKAVNLESPTNTSFNDLYYTLNSESTEAYLSSNRTGSLYLEEGYEACCYDIYKVDIEEIFIDLNALTFNELTRDSLVGARVKIIDAITGELLYEQLNELGHDHKFRLKCGKEYLIVTEKDGYEPDTTNLTLRECDKEEIIKKIYLTPKEVRLDVFTFDESTLRELEGATVVLVPADGEEITITNREGHDYSFDIIAGGSYKLIVTKPGYERAEIIVNSDNIIDGVVTERIYLRRDDLDLNEYLPVLVFFDNDRPDPRARKLFTDKTYTETYFDYLAKKEDFKTKYSNSLSGDLRSQASADVENFFELEVKNGYANLQRFIGKLQARLEAGDKIELSLKGYASPRAANRYNLALGQRRIWTIKNEISAFANSALASYIVSGQLVVTEISFGEEIAPSSVSDSYSNRRLSVYSPEASRERKAEIVRVRVLN